MTQLSGGLGNDVYSVGSVGDKVTEAAGQGIDTVQTELGSYLLGANIEGLAFGDFANHAVGTGNTLNNTITGNDGNNKLDGQTGDDTLSGGLGNDTLIGGIGNDVLDGGSGDDVMNGGTGNDTYVVDDIDDQVQEAVNAGTDTVRSSIDFTLGATLENLVLLAGHTGIGNDFNNIITGSSGADTIQGGKGNDSLFGNGLADSISGGDGNDLIEGGLGNDSLNGGPGNDVFLYRLENIIDPLGTDTITGFEIGKDRIDLLDLFSDFDVELVGSGRRRVPPPPGQRKRHPGAVRQQWRRQRVFHPGDPAGCDRRDDGRSHLPRSGSDRGQLASGEDQLAIDPIIDRKRTRPPARSLVKGFIPGLFSK